VRGTGYSRSLSDDGSGSNYIFWPISLILFTDVSPCIAFISMFFNRCLREALLGFLSTYNPSITYFFDLLSLLISKDFFDFLFSLIGDLTIGSLDVSS
jgi:hypothetical protein